MKKETCAKWRLSTLCFFLFLLTSCHKYDPQLERALTLAKENRLELEKVLAYYANDSLKLEAAKFLICNMPGHYSYRGNDINTYYGAVDSAVNLKRSVAEMSDTLEKVSLKFASGYPKVQDVEIMTSDYLIANIEDAFQVWENGKWATHVSFQDFCECILPYKSTELQPLDNWRTYLKGRYDSGLPELSYCDSYENSAIWATHRVNSNLKDSLKPSVFLSKMHPVYRLMTKLRMPFGVCQDYVEIATSVLRSKGIPVMVDFTPQWPFRRQGHSWNVVLANSGKNIQFGGVDSNPGEPHKLDEKMAKVYRSTYAMNPEMVDLLENEKYVPRSLATPFIKDVTSEYMKTDDVEVHIEKQKGKYVYLAVFDDQRWMPVAFGAVDGKTAIFKNMGRDIVYLPVSYTESGVKPIGNPFILTSKGEVKKITPDKSTLQPLALFRKYALFPHVQFIAKRIIGGQFQAANSSTFEDAITLYQTKEWGVRGVEVEVSPLAKSYRYWRFYQPTAESYCNVAEISFLERTSHQFIRGKIIGAEGSYGDNPGTCKEAAFDGNLLTFFDAPIDAGAWVGMDFGRPVDIERIMYTPRGDGNTIHIGDKYELFYWADNRWNTLGTQQAVTVKLNYENVPSNALYLLKNLTEGNEERIFTYVNGKQMFW